MIVSASLIATAVVLCAVGGILMLTRPLTRILLGAVILGNGINLLVLASTGRAPSPTASRSASSMSARDTRIRRCACWESSGRGQLGGA
ncbi:hypothetical protein ACZ90_14840 [Streptomyces albus subsp. albus]|nr:hypothetical protein ACZ90_14840 [Streptomyces albus subsp. albus]